MQKGKTPIGLIYNAIHTIGSEVLGNIMFLLGIEALSKIVSRTNFWLLPF